MNRVYQLQQEGAICPLHGRQGFEGSAWEGNLLQDVGAPLLIADVHGEGRLACGCPVTIDWYATDEQPQAHREG